MYRVVLFLHLLGALALVSGIAVAGVAFEAARRRDRPAEVAILLGLGRVGALLVAVGMLLAGGCGLWLAHLGGWGYGSFWVACSIVLFPLALVLGGAGGQRPKRARRLAVQLASADAPISAELRGLLDDSTTQALNYLALLMVLAIVALMCFKP